MERGPNSTFNARNSEPGWWFKFHTKNCGISVGHSFYPIELKNSALPIYVIQNQKKYKTISAKSAKSGFLLVV
jgi:hypothetical protein